MAHPEYTEKQHAEHLERWRKTGEFPENSVFDPAGHAQGGPLFRKLAPEAKAATAPAKTGDADREHAGKEE